ncbi:MAG: sigma-54-dependent Fis family transcriptional regulator [Deltaproteobacteria bacterium]|nr:sigma-54-dependent Fis family transcriptional regulator [Deltaproteobacteria bacterium]
MKNKTSFLEMAQFFQGRPTAIPGSPEYNAAFCRMLLTAAAADAASIWQVDTENQLRLISSTDIPQDRVMDISIREGEGISGAAVLSRQPVFVANAQKQTFHDSRVDERFGLRTYAMISAPIVFEDHLFGVINILNHHSDKLFLPEWKEWLSALAVMYGAALARAGRLTPYRVPSKMRMGMEGKSPQVPEGKTVIVGISQAVQEALHLCLKAGETEIPVLICGETGTGKELAARRIHEASPRAKGPFIEVNCAALSETLLESELFGHVKGAFTGATHNRQGKFVAASKGTLFLDEIGEMSLASQAKILRVLEEKKVTPLGSEKPVPSDTRIIAATNKNLTEMVKEKRLREDLYYRLCGLEIRMPPLRERVEDIPLLAIHFLNKAYSQQKKKVPLKRPLRLSSEALEMLVAFDWPGNVRQLEQALFAAAALCEGDEIIPANFPAWFREAAASQAKQQMTYPSGSHPPELESLPEKGRHFLKEEERKRYLEALQATKYPGTGRWNVSAAARQLGIPRETLTYHLKKLGIL